MVRFEKWRENIFLSVTVPMVRDLFELFCYRSVFLPEVGGLMLPCELDC